MNQRFQYKGIVHLLIRVALVLSILILGLRTLTIPVNAAGKQVWAVSLDNDLFTPFATSDRDFTGGMALTYADTQGADNWRYLDSLLGGIDDTFKFQSADRSTAIPSVELGYYGFTPRATNTPEVVPNDRPYASLVYLSLSRQYPIKTNRRSISTSLTIGVLGLNIMESAQRAVHRVTDSDDVQGWHNQVSDGGELTARYQIALHEEWNGNTPFSRFKTTWFASLGYLTEAGVAFSTRQGLISSPDNRFNPELIAYGERVNETATTPNHGEERYFWGGIGLKARAYNAFLQGQFRDSVHMLDADALQPLIVEGWLGYTFTIGNAYKASYVLRAQSSEIQGGEGDRSHVWGGIVVSRGV